MPDTETSPVPVRNDGTVALVVINRPYRRNALDVATKQASGIRTMCGRQRRQRAGGGADRRRDVFLRRARSRRFGNTVARQTRAFVDWINGQTPNPGPAQPVRHCPQTAHRRRPLATHTVVGVPRAEHVPRANKA